jgi:hypothetical protein
LIVVAGEAGGELFGGAGGEPGAQLIADLRRERAQVLLAGAALALDGEGQEPGVAVGDLLGELALLDAGELGGEAGGGQLGLGGLEVAGSPVWRETACRA